MESSDAPFSGVALCHSWNRENPRLRYRVVTDDVTYDVTLTDTM